MQRGEEAFRRIIRHALAAAHLAIEMQQFHHVAPALEQPVADEAQVIILLRGVGVEEELAAAAVDPGAAPYSRVRGDGLTESLREVGVAAGPVEHAPQQGLGLHPFLPRLATAGFIKVPERFTPRPFILLGKILDAELPSDVLAPASWMITLADWDVM